MTVMNGFSRAAQEMLGYYVYALKDPRDNEFFYIGKGTRNRIFSHINEALDSPTSYDTLDRIREIRKEGLRIEHIILRHGLTEKEALEVEATLIDYIGLEDLSNRVQGHDAESRGIMTISEVQAAYDALPIEITEPSILIFVNKLYRRGMNPEQLYDITRGNWVIGPRRSKATYGFAVYHGIVREVYQIHQWLLRLQEILPRNVDSAGGLKVRLQKICSNMWVAALNIILILVPRTQYDI